MGKEALILFGFDLYDKNCDGKIDEKELTTMLKDLYGRSFATNKNAIRMLERINTLESSLDADMFREFSKKHPSLFFPAYEMQLKLQRKILGRRFWERHAKKHVTKELRVKDIIAINTDQQKFRDIVHHPLYRPPTADSRPSTSQEGAAPPLTSADSTRSLYGHSGGADTQKEVEEQKRVLQVITSSLDTRAKRAEYVPEQQRKRRKEKQEKKSSAERKEREAALHHMKLIAVEENDPNATAAAVRERLALKKKGTSRAAIHQMMHGGRVDPLEAAATGSAARRPPRRRSTSDARPHLPPAARRRSQDYILPSDSMATSSGNNDNNGGVSKPRRRTLPAMHLPSLGVGSPSKVCPEEEHPLAEVQGELRRRRGSC